MQRGKLARREMGAGGAAADAKDAGVAEPEPEEPEPEVTEVSGGRRWVGWLYAARHAARTGITKYMGYRDKWQREGDTEVWSLGDV
jgi:hypothetical protein